ncbi:MAG TPA: hypothetical protein ENI63_01470 [Candidatus Kaiserbacteria bacterium]|nr:hypothetical protein [Candidatus Kaiserbacteria bacterium]
MKIVYKYPPNIEKIRAVFPLHKGIIFTYGDTLYNPDRGKIDEALMKHEETHTRQQGDDIDGWWEKYFVDVDFRMKQELEAYQNQYKYAVENYSRNMRRVLLKVISKDLSSAMYGNIISEEEAKGAIKEMQEQKKLDTGII